MPSGEAESRGHLAGQAPVAVPTHYSCALAGPPPGAPADALGAPAAAGKA